MRKSVQIGSIITRLYVIWHPLDKQLSVINQEFYLNFAAKACLKIYFWKVLKNFVTSKPNCK